MKKCDDEILANFWTGIYIGKFIQNVFYTKIYVLWDSFFMFFKVKDLMYIMIKINLAGKNTTISVYWSECVYLITYKADDGESRATRCRLRWRELLPLAGILDVSSSSVHLNIEIFQYYDKMEGSVLYITYNSYDSNVMGRTLTTGDKVCTHFAQMNIKYS